MSKSGKNAVAARAKVDREALYSRRSHCADARIVVREVRRDGRSACAPWYRSAPGRSGRSYHRHLAAWHGSTVRVLVFAQGEAARIAEDAGADFVGGDELVAKINDGWVEFDAAIATADMMGKVGTLGRAARSPRSYPNPRSGTVVRSPEDLPNVIKDLKGGRVEFR